MASATSESQSERERPKTITPTFVGYSIGRWLDTDGDGRFDTLDKVIDHYNNGVKNHPNADGRLRGRLGLSVQDKNNVIAFLKTLTDQKFLTDPKFSDPFQ